MRKLLLALALCVSCLHPTRALGQTSCPGDTYLGWGQSVYPNSLTRLNVSFANSAGWAIFYDGLQYNADNSYTGCDPSQWNAENGLYGGAIYGTMSYDDGEISYTGACRFWVDIRPATVTPVCDDGSEVYSRMVTKLKIQSCTSTHTLTNRFIAVSQCPYYCEESVGPVCSDSGYISQNWINLTISGF